MTRPDQDSAPNPTSGAADSAKLAKQSEAAEARKQLRALRRQKRERAAQRQMALYAFTLVGLGLLYWMSQGRLDDGPNLATRQQVVLREATRSMLRTEAPSIVQELTESDERKSAAQRELVSALARRHVGVSPTGGSADLHLLQQIIDARVLATDQSFELQALGVTLGDVMANQLGLRWVVVDDEYGRTRALQYGKGEDVFFPITMISRRYEADIFVDVAALYRDMEGEVEKLQAAARAAAAAPPHLPRNPSR